MRELSLFLHNSLLWVAAGERTGRDANIGLRFVELGALDATSEEETVDNTVRVVALALWDPACADGCRGDAFCGGAVSSKG